MRKPIPATATTELEKLHAYTAARLAAGAETKPLAEPLEVAMRKLVATDARYHELENAVMALMALRDTSDGEADELLRRLYRELQIVEGNASLGRTGKLVFPKGLVAVTSCPLRDQPGEMRIVAGKVAAAADTRISGYASSLEEKASALEDRNLEYEAGLQQVGIAFADVVRERLEWIRAYEKTYGALVALHGKVKAEGFFKKAPKRKKKAPATA